MYLHASGVASPKGCMELSPGWSVLCDTRGYRTYVKIAPRQGCTDYFRTALVIDRRYS